MFEIKIRETGELIENKIATEKEATEMVAKWEAMDKQEDIYIDDYYEITGEEDISEYVCSRCSGSGEGCAEGWVCTTCDGKGTIYLLED
jgi:DnaJ-class molecular chaperone